MAENRELTLTDKKKLEEEMAELVEAKKRVAEEIKIARGFGDLSENAEYDAAKKEEAHVYGRIAELEELLRTATFVDDTAVSTDTVAVGTVVRVLDEEFDEEDEYTLVGFTEADPTEAVHLSGIADRRSAGWQARRRPRGRKDARRNREDEGSFHSQEISFRQPAVESNGRLFSIDARGVCPAYGEELP